MNHISCDVVKDLLPLYVDDVCSEDSKRIVSGHLESCSRCKEEYEKITQVIPVEHGNSEQSAIAAISRRWRRDKKKAFFIGFMSLLILVAAAYAFLQYSYQNPVSINPDEITVSNVCELADGNIFFSLKVPDQVRVLRQSWKIKGDTVYIEMEKLRINPFPGETNYSDFGTNTWGNGNWMFNVGKSGINKIYYCSELPKNEEETAFHRILIWSSDMDTAAADSAVETYVKTYSCYGNEEIGVLAATLFASIHPYVGDMPANERLLGALNIGLSLGSYQNSLQTEKEPYGWTLEFKNFVAEADEENFNQTMTNYAYILLALTGNLGEVTWTYRTESGEELMSRTVTTAEASEKLGKDIKSFSESYASVQELLLTIGME